MNIMWTIFMLCSLAFILVNNPTALLPAFTASSTNALQLTLNLCGVYAVWLGLINILKQSGALDWLTVLLSPIISKLFKSATPQQLKYITLNLTANLIGIGNAATPSAIAAIKQMDNGQAKATKNMIMLFVINSIGFQLLPTTILGMRAAAQSVTPASIVLPCIVVSIVTCALGILLVKLVCRD